MDDKKKMTGKEARYVLRQRRVSLSDLASRLGISSQALNSRLNAETSPAFTGGGGRKNIYLTKNKLSTNRERQLHQPSLPMTVLQGHSQQ